MVLAVASNAKIRKKMKLRGNRPFVQFLSETQKPFSQKSQIQTKFEKERKVAHARKVDVQRSTVSAIRTKSLVLLSASAKGAAIVQLIHETQLLRT